MCTWLVCLLVDLLRLIDHLLSRIYFAKIESLRSLACRMVNLLA